MSTLEFVSTSAGGIADGDAPLVTAPALVAALGTHPAITVPLVIGRAPATGLIWRLLEETAHFFDTDLPPAAALADALQNLLAEAQRRHGPVTLAAHVMVVELEARAEFVVSAQVIDPVRVEPVALAVAPGPPPAAPPQWRRMAARTSSHAAGDRAARDLAAAGYVDEVYVEDGRVHPPRLGALIVETAEGAVGTGAERLELARAAGLLAALQYSDEPVSISAGARAWWLSPRFETHPIGAIGARRVRVEPA